MKGFADNTTVISKPNYTQLFKECNHSASSGETPNILLHTLTNYQEAPDIELKHKKPQTACCESKSQYTTNKANKQKIMV